MGLELDELQRKKTRLENEILSLSRREEVLVKVTEMLEEKLEARSVEKGKPRHEVLSRFVDGKNSLTKQQNEMIASEKTRPLEIGLRLENRVRLNGNVVFSWSYQKLPKS